MRISSEDLFEQGSNLVVAADLAADGRLSQADGNAAILAGLSMLFSYFSQVEADSEAATAEYNAELHAAVDGVLDELEAEGAV